MKTLTALFLSALLGLWLVGCKQSSSGTGADGDGHTHSDGSTHEDHEDHDDHADHADGGEDDHDHGEEASLGSTMIGDMKVEFSQGHGAVEADKEGHLVVKLPYSDNGATTVRAWIGTADRTLSLVGKGEYAASHDDYDVHAVAPDPLPANVLWWVEIEKPDGTKAVGSVKPVLD